MPHEPDPAAFPIYPPGLVACPRCKRKQKTYLDIVGKELETRCRVCHFVLARVWRGCGTEA